MLRSLVDAFAARWTVRASARLVVAVGAELDNSNTLPH